MQKLTHKRQFDGSAKLVPVEQPPTAHWFKRSDGILFSAEEGSYAFSRMVKLPGTFDRCNAAGELLEEN
jgi:hypothetical protein